MEVIGFRTLPYSQTEIRTCFLKLDLGDLKYKSKLQIDVFYNIYDVKFLTIDQFHIINLVRKGAKINILTQFFLVSIIDGNWKYQIECYILSHNLIRSI